jgi:murein DD-endopeptidase MepM/ murein hydrolase activator NlpD
MKESEFTGNKSGFAVYKTTFERGVFSFHIALNESRAISGLQFQPYVPDNLPKMERNASLLILPFKGTWTVFWGGDNKQQNYHVESRAQKNAFDMVIMDAAGKSYRSNGKTNEDYYAFGKELLAPCDGEVVLVVDGIKDNTPGESNVMYVPGNTVIIKTANNEYLFFAHFKQHSIKVKQGDKIKQDQLLGLCGNSGNSSEPHLHFHIQNVENINIATGVKCFFDQLKVNGEMKKDYSPIKGERIGR